MREEGLRVKRMICLALAVDEPAARSLTALGALGPNSHPFCLANIASADHNSVSVNLTSSALRFPQDVILDFLCSISSLL